MAIERIAVVGAGQMGPGIAQVAAQAGLAVVLADASAELARKARRASSAATLGKLVEKGKISAGRPRRGPRRASAPPPRLEDCAGADLAIEAIVENEGVKKELFRKLDALLPRARDPRLEHELHLDHRARRGDAAPGAGHRHALHEPGAGDEARRDHPRAADHRRDLRRRVVALAKRFGKTTVTSKDSPGLHRQPRSSSRSSTRPASRSRRGSPRRRTSTPAVKLGPEPPDGPARARRLHRPRHLPRSSPRCCTASSATTSTGPRRSSGSTSPPAGSAGRAGAASTATTRRVSATAETHGLREHPVRRCEDGVGDAHLQPARRS